MRLTQPTAVNHIRLTDNQPRRAGGCIGEMVTQWSFSAYQCSSSAHTLQCGAAFHVCEHQSDDHDQRGSSRQWSFMYYTTWSAIWCFCKVNWPLRGKRWVTVVFGNAFEQNSRLRNQSELDCAAVDMFLVELPRWKMSSFPICVLARKLCWWFGFPECFQRFPLQHMNWPTVYFSSQRTGP